MSGTYKVVFWQKTCLGEFWVKAKDEEDAEKQAFWQLHKFDRDAYDICDVEEFEDEDEE